MTGSAGRPLAARARPEDRLGLVVVLFKARVVALLLLAAVAGAFVGAGGWPEPAALAVLLLAGGLTSMGSSALNEYLERDRDGVMERTRLRPLVTGAISRPSWVPVAGAALVVLPVLAVAPHNPALAAFLGLGAAIYLGVYTVWLKPRTSWNIVIGGTAGSCTVLSGGAAVGAWDAPGVLALALLVFFWTPIHFWTLAMMYRDDYARARVPMLPVLVGPRVAAFWSLVHGAGAAAAGLWLAGAAALGAAYLAPTLAATTVLLAHGLALVLRPARRQARLVFHTSNAYLAVVLVAACLGAVVG